MSNEASMAETRRKIAEHQKKHGDLLYRCRISIALLEGIVYLGWITHPNIALRLVEACGLDDADFDNLVNEKWHGTRAERQKLMDKKSRRKAYEGMDSCYRETEW